MGNEERTLRYSYFQATGSDGRMISPGFEVERVFLVAVFEEALRIPEAGIAALPEMIWMRHQNEFGGRPLGKKVRSMVVGDVVVLHDGPSPSGLDSNSTVFVADTCGFVRAGRDLADEAIALADRGAPAHGSVRGQTYFGSFRKHEAETVEA